MQTFEYQALNPQGKTCKGIMEADSARAVRQQLRDQDLLTLDITAVSHRLDSASGALSVGWLKKRIGIQDLMVITQQLATLISSGMPLESEWLVAV